MSRSWADDREPFPLPFLQVLPLLLAGLVSAQETSSSTPTVPLAPTAKTLQNEFVALARTVFPSVVTVRSFVRVAVEASAKATSPDGAPASTKPPNPTSPTSTLPTSTPPATQPANAAAAENRWVVPPDDRDYPGFRLHRGASGFFVAAGGEVLTGLHALQREDGTLADLVEIETNTGQRAIAEVVGIEPTLQLAVLRAVVFHDHTPPPLPVLAFGDSDATEPGQWLLGVGDPVGPERFLGIGLLVGKPSRDCYQELMSATYMQATLTVPDGAIGGPLVDLDGKVVGILSKLDGNGPGSAWALPSKILEGLHQSIRTAGTSRSPWLGWSVMSRTEIATVRGLKAWKELPKPPHGILIENVFAPSPAHAADVRPGDFLTHFAGVEIHAPVDFQRQLYLNGVGRTVTVTMWRDGQSITKELQIEARPAAAVPR